MHRNIFIRRVTMICINIQNSNTFLSYLKLYFKMKETMFQARLEMDGRLVKYSTFRGII